MHGYQGASRSHEGDISTIPEINLEDLDSQTDVTVAQLANKKQYTLIGAT